MIERIGNALPHPATLFALLAAMLVLLSWLLSKLGVTAINPIDGVVVQPISLISREGLHWILEHTIENYTGFAPLGTVLVAMLGIGVAEKSGLIATVLRLLVHTAPRRLVTFVIVAIGLLGLALPRAKFVHCYRDPVQNCFSIHKMPFDKKQAYAHSQGALGLYYNRYWKLMQRWKSLFPDRILDVRYEDTVADIENQGRRVLDFLDLPFEEGVLDFYKTKRLVKTPSASQVREPIYKDQVQAWKKYEKQLQPLVEALDDLTGHSGS